MTQAYRARLERAILKNLQSALVELQKRLGPLRSQDEKESLPLWERRRSFWRSSSKKGP